MDSTKKTFKRRGFWWRTMGFTKCHLIGVFATETVLGILGISFMVGAVFHAVFQDGDLTFCLLATAACFFLAQIGVLLSSILSLLFYAGSQVETKDMRGCVEDSQPAAAVDAPIAPRAKAHVRKQAE
jgi:uncharacterized membrane protein